MAAEREGDSLGSAARALSTAVGALTRVVGQGLTEASREVGDELVAALRAASDDLADASAQAARHEARLRAKARKVGQARADGTDRRRARAATTRAQLLAAAATVFAEKGYEGSSVGDVAAEAGYTKGAVYAHFASKEDLLAGIVAQLAEADEELFASGPSVREIFCSGDDPDTLRRTLLALEVYTYAVRHPEARSRMAPLVASTWDHAAALLAATRTGAEDSRAQDVAPSQDDRDLALALLSVHTFAQVLGSVLGDDTAQASAARTVDRLLRAQTTDDTDDPQAQR